MRYDLRGMWLYRHGIGSQRYGKKRPKVNNQGRIIHCQANIIVIRLVPPLSFFSIHALRMSLVTQTKSKHATHKTTCSDHIYKNFLFLNTLVHSHIPPPRLPASLGKHLLRVAHLSPLAHLPAHLARELQFHSLHGEHARGSRPVSASAARQSLGSGSHQRVGRPFIPHDR